MFALPSGTSIYKETVLYQLQGYEHSRNDKKEETDASITLRLATFVYMWVRAVVDGCAFNVLDCTCTETLFLLGSI